MATLKQRLHRKNSSGTYDIIHLETSADCITGTLPVSHGGTGNTTGLAASATKLATARTIRTNLASTSTASFNGTANITPGITGTLPVSHGGTGRSTLTSGYFLRGNGTGAVTMSSIDQVKSALGVDDSSQSGVIMKILFETGALYNPSGETVADLNSSVSVGSVVVFDGKLWRVVHKSGSVVYLASQYWIRNTQFDSGGSTAYKVSQ